MPKQGGSGCYPISRSTKPGRHFIVAAHVASDTLRTPVTQLMKQARKSTDDGKGLTLLRLTLNWRTRRALVCRCAPSRKGYRTRRWCKTCGHVSRLRLPGSAMSSIAWDALRCLLRREEQDRPSQAKQASMQANASEGGKNAVSLAIPRDSSRLQYRGWCSLGSS